MDDNLGRAEGTVPSCLIEGKPGRTTDDGFLDRFSPLSGTPLPGVSSAPQDEIDRAVASARRAVDDGRWRNLAPAARKRCLLAFAELIDLRSAELDRLDAIDMGKPVSLQFCNARAAADFVRFNAEAVDKLTGELFASDCASLVIQQRIPRGVVAAIASWNFPTFVALLKAAPALAAGNCVILKPSEHAPSSSLLLVELALEAGLPPGVLNLVNGVGSLVGDALARHRDVDMVTFTGSTAVGKAIMQAAAQSNMKLVLAECGGKSPQIIFDDGLDLALVAEHVSASILTNQGQVCSAGSRVLVARSAVDSLLESIVRQFSAVRIGDPLDLNVNFGPIATRRQLERIEGFVAGAVAAGGSLVCGGQRILEETGGNFIRPALFQSLSPDAQLLREEVFGPVLPVITFDDEEEAVALANDSDFALSATVWSARTDTGLRVAQRLDSTVSVMATFSPGAGAGFATSCEPAKQSGVGVEGGVAGLQSYLRRRTMTVFHG